MRASIDKARHPSRDTSPLSDLILRLALCGDTAAAAAALAVLDDSEFATAWYDVTHASELTAETLSGLSAAALVAGSASRVEQILASGIATDRAAQIAAGRALLRLKRPAEALPRLQAAHRGGEETDASLLLDLARLTGDLKQPDAAMGYLAQIPLPGLAWDPLAKAARLATKLAASATVNSQPLRVAVLAEQTPQYLMQALDLALRQDGYAPSLYDGGYRQIEQQVLAPNSPLYATALDAVVLVPSAFALDTSVYESDPVATATRIAQRWSGLVAALRAKTAAPILLANYLPLPAAVLPNWQGGRAESGLGIIAEINRQVAANAGPGVIVLDVATTLRAAGHMPVWQPAEYGLARVEIPLDSLGAVAAKMAALISLAVRGRGIKCVVTDLDNTLWGGVVGDAGPGGITTGRDGSGLAFFRYQKLLADLKALGIVLAIASKNDEANVTAAFAARAGDMAVTLDEFVVRRINWQPKGGNVRAIAEELNIGLDALLFIDDNPMEREQVRQTCPGVRVPVWPAEAVDLADRIAGLPYLDLLTISKEDLRRHDMYVSREKMKQEAASATGNYDDFLKGLAMQAHIEPLTRDNAARVHQLVMKTNQFNLTTVRRTQAELEAMAADGRHLFLCARLADRLDEHGLTNVMILSLAGTTAHIDTWLMSCRVFSRGFDAALLAHAAAVLASRGITEITGTYRPTPKNKEFAELYATLGFAPVAATDAETRWRADLARWTPPAHHITVVAAG
ncbi:MAG: HAD-IIIC family phosphatase [Hyphomicrobiaceae bacterium]